MADTGVYKGKNFWAAVGADTGTTKTGGIPFGLRVHAYSTCLHHAVCCVSDLVMVSDICRQSS